MPEQRLPIIYRVHAVQRMAERGFEEEDISRALHEGKEIESYPHDNPYPSRLLLAWVKGRPAHASPPLPNMQ
ncbi:MAG TPA: DUF4258 domain-containing protein [Candidatus Acidoferrales bacterium]|nr:DUF4258 domain-containing protein [Candidatus Acidoferrales bacterium]